MNLNRLEDLLTSVNKVEVVDEGRVINSKLSMDDSILLLIFLWGQVRSKDPNTKVGAGVYDESTGSLFLGYNGFPAGYPDDANTWARRDSEDGKYALVRHGESNAILKAIRAGFSPESSTLYVTHFPCRNCMKDFVIPSGIRKIIHLSDYPQDEISLELIEHYDVQIEQASTDLIEKVS